MGNDPNRPKRERYVDPFACPEGIRLWELYRESVPWGLKVPPTDAEDIIDPEPELQDYLAHYANCGDCNEI